MSELIEFPGPGGRPVLVEVEGPRSGPITRGGGRGSDAVTKASEGLEQVLSCVGPAVRGIVHQLREAAERPDEVEVEFSVKLSTDANVIIAKTGADANFRIVLKWKGS